MFFDDTARSFTSILESAERERDIQEATRDHADYYDEAPFDKKHSEESIPDDSIDDDPFGDDPDWIDYDDEDDDYDYDDLDSDTSEYLSWPDMSPRDFYNYLSDLIYAQEDAKRAASMLLYNHIHDHPRNLLFVGPTGCGKTAIWEAAKKIYPYIIIADGSRITQDGWKGDYKLSDILNSMPVCQTEHSIIVIDEADKMFTPRYTSQGENTSLAIQNEFLRMIEGGEVKAGKTTFTMKSASFVFLGSFEGLFENKNMDRGHHAGFGAQVMSAREATYEQDITIEDLQYAGIRREIAGRIDDIVQLRPITGDDFMEILKISSMSPLSQLEEAYHIRLKIPEAALHRLCNSAVSSKMGVRYLRSRVQHELDRQMFDDPTNKEYLLFPELAASSALFEPQTEDSRDDPAPVPAA